jgi:hypothetical protein
MQPIITETLLHKLILELVNWRSVDLPSLPALSCVHKFRCFSQKTGKMTAVDSEAVSEYRKARVAEAKLKVEVWDVGRVRIIF